MNIKFKNDRLSIDGHTFTVDNLDKFPSHLDPANSCSTETDTHIYFWTKHSPLSNHHPSPFSLDGTSYSSAEQCIMHQKALMFNDNLTASRIMASNDPGNQKSLGNNVNGFNRASWNNHSHDIVKRTMTAKFTQNPKLTDILKASGDKILVEASPHDKYWGAGLRHDDPMIKSSKNWPGKNVMGSLLSELRSDISYTCD